MADRSKQTETFPGRYDAIRSLCEFVSDGAAAAGLDEDAIFHVELSCDEASTNIIEHAYGGEDKGAIVVTYEYDDEDFVIIFEDRGRAFTPDEVPAPGSQDTDAGLQLKIGGLGLHFMRNLMDEVHFSFDAASGNKLTMVKKIASKES